MKFFWLCTAMAACLAVGVLVGGLSMAKGAPQEATAAAVALCVAVIPYVFTRAIEGWATATWRARMLQIAEKSNAERQP